MRESVYSLCRTTAQVRLTHPIGYMSFGCIVLIKSMPILWCKVNRPSTVKIFSDLDEALRKSQDHLAESATSKPKLSTPSLISVPSVVWCGGYEYIDSRSLTRIARNLEKVSSASSSSGDSETSTMESIATRPLKPFSYKPSHTQGALSQPSFYPGNELLINFDNRRQAHLITVMHTANNSQRTKVTWLAWYHAGTCRTTRYVKLSGEEFEELPECTKRPVYVQAVHAIQVLKT
ncbi:hypothetical protein D9757_011344 [Collybiopsis confluens]|uniref:Uncharacterized protein n=1 Tax=Collybiopsis confluens TaxID=2823264 RepID=A0A8H5LNV3_9AGAR|nr:hypothetical protein D9757_011344 [Collybiopsis confluens]